MNIPESIQAFIRKSVELENFCLPHFYPKVDSFEAFQIGYKTHGRTGETTTGEKEGDFRASWFVICSSYDASPFFIDLDEGEAGFPIYFAWNGSGNWKPIKVAKSIDEFSEFLVLLKGFESAAENTQDRVGQSFDLSDPFWNEVWKEYEGFDEE